MSNGSLGVAVVSQVSADRKNHPSFAKASVAWSQDDPDVLCFGRRDGTNTLRTRDQCKAPDLILPPGHPFSWRDGLQRNVEIVYSAIVGRQPALPFALLNTAIAVSSRLRR